MILVKSTSHELSKIAAISTPTNPYLVINTESVTASKNSPIVTSLMLCVCQILKCAYGLFLSNSMQKPNNNKFKHSGAIFALFIKS